MTLPRPTAPAALSGKLFAFEVGFFDPTFCHVILPFFLVAITSTMSGNAEEEPLEETVEDTELEKVADGVNNETDQSDESEEDERDLRSGNSGKPGYSERLMLVNRPFLAAPMISLAILRLRPLQKSRPLLPKNLSRRRSLSAR